MPEEGVVERARRNKKEGKPPSTQAGEFVREEIEHVREGNHRARSVQRAMAIGLSKARRAGVKRVPPKKWRQSRQRTDSASSSTLFVWARLSAHRRGRAAREGAAGQTKGPEGLRRAARKAARTRRNHSGHE